MVGRYSNSLKVRFWNNVQKTDTCWLWHGGETFRLGNKKYYPRKVAYILTTGSQARHTHLINQCGSPLCINPDHHKLREKRSRKRKCYTCKKDIVVSFAIIEKSKSGKVFCGKSCAVTENNKGKPRFKSKGWEGLQRASVKAKWVREIGDLVCRLCGFDGLDKPWCIELDHILAVSRGGSNLPENLQPLCLNCHKDKTVAEIKNRV